MAQKREELTKAIMDGLWKLRDACDRRGKGGLFDLHRFSEDSICLLLNAMLDAKFENKNLIRVNFEAIDLSDEGRSECVQITTENSKAKVQHTLDMFVKKGLHLKYKTLKVLVIGEKKTNYALTIPSGVKFAPDTDIIDLHELLKVGGTLRVPTLRRMLAIINEELGVDDVDAPPKLDISICQADASRPSLSELSVEWNKAPTSSVDALKAYKSEHGLEPLKPSALDKIAVFVGKEGSGPRKVAEYNRELDAHLTDYREWLMYCDVVKGSFPISVWLTNDGGECEDLSIELTFPPGCVVLDDENLMVLEVPTAPSAPNRPPTSSANFIRFSDPIRRSSVPLKDVSQIEKAIKDADNSELQTILITVERMRAGERKRLALKRLVVSGKGKWPLKVGCRIVASGAKAVKTVKKITTKKDKKKTKKAEDE